MAPPDTETISWLRVFIAFAVVFGLLSLLGFGLKYISVKGLRFPDRMMPGRPRQQRLQVVESLALDMRRRLVLVRQDDAEHLLLLGLNQDIVVETNLKRSSPRETKPLP